LNLGIKLIQRCQVSFVTGYNPASATQSSEEPQKSKSKKFDRQENVQLYFVDATLQEPSVEHFDKAVELEASFVLGTNDMTVTASEIYEIYCKEQQGVERAFRFLKNPLYFADAFFLKNRKRVVALVTIMSIALLIFSLLQRKLRLLLDEKSETVSNQKKKPTKRPTMNWVNLCFDGVDLIRKKFQGNYIYTFVRMDDFVRKVLDILGTNYQNRYSCESLIKSAC
jgi:transposase